MEKHDIDTVACDVTHFVSVCLKFFSSFPLNPFEISHFPEVDPESDVRKVIILGFNSYKPKHIIP